MRANKGDFKCTFQGRLLQRMCDANCPCSKHGRTLDFPRRMTRASRIERLDYLKDQLRKRVVILDGAMGTNIQKFRLEEERMRPATPTT